MLLGIIIDFNFYVVKISELLYMVKILINSLSMCDVSECTWM